MLNILQVVSNLEVGGAQEVVRTLVENIAEAGYRPVVCTFRDGPLRQPIERLGIPVEVLPERRHSVLNFFSFLIELLHIRLRLVALVKEYEIDVIQTHLLRILDFLVLSLRLGSDVAIFWTFHNFRFDLRQDHLSHHKWLLRPKRLGYKLLYRLGARWVNGLIAVSEDVKRAIQENIGGIPDHKITIIANSVDLTRYQRAVDRLAIRRYLGLAPDDQVMAVVATFKRQKGHRYLIDAASLVVPQFPNLRILLIGDGELSEELSTQTRALGLEKHIRFLGIRKDVPDLLAASDCFVLPSLWEGLSIALVEAMASGLPVIATEVSGTRQVIVSGESGLLVPPGDTRLLAGAMLELLSNPQKARTLGIAGRQRVEKHFNAQKQASNHIALFTRALLSRRNRARPSLRKERRLPDDAVSARPAETASPEGGSQ
jgi:glycosyltransferase involved in cell wall biosynthesis